MTRMLAERPAWLPGERELQAFYGKTALYPYYRIKLTEYLARLLPESGPCSIVDVGAGDGSLGAVFQTYRPDTTVIGLEVSVRAATRAGFKMVAFDGRQIPFPDASFDVTVISNVLHHAANPLALLLEARRVTRRRVVIKDHLTTGKVDDIKLALLDVMGNLRLGAQVSATYLSRQRWQEMFAALPNAKADWYEDLSFRRGLMAKLFPNGLEVIFSLELTPS